MWRYIYASNYTPHLRGAESKYTCNEEATASDSLLSDVIKKKFLLGFFINFLFRVGNLSEYFDHLYHFLLPKSLLTFFKYDFNHWSSIQPVDVSFFKLSVISGLKTKFVHNFNCQSVFEPRWFSFSKKRLFLLANYWRTRNYSLIAKTKIEYQ